MSFLVSAALSAATLLRMGPMATEPVADNVITRAEQVASSACYGLVSHANGLMAVRYAVTYFGWTRKGFYFAVRSSVPDAPQALTDEDRIALVLLPPGAREPLRFTKRVREGRTLKGIVDCGVPVAETEMFVPYSKNLPQPRDGETWGLNMSVDFSSERETASWHVGKGGDANGPEALGTLAIDAAAPTVSLFQFGTLETWRPSGRGRFGFRIANRGETPAKLSAKASLLRGIDFSKLDSNAERDLARERHAITAFDGVTVAPGETKTLYHFENNIWSGTIAQLDAEISADGRALWRRKIAFDISRGKTWKAGALPLLKVKYFPSYGNTVTFECSANGAKDIRDGRVALRGVASGKTVWEKRIANGHAFERFSDAVSFPDLPEDDYEMTFTCADARGKKYSHTRTFSRRSFPWQGNAIGKDRIVIPPFKAIDVTRGAGKGDDATIAFLQTGYRTGSNVLWDEVYGKGENLLAAPMTLTLNGRTFAVTGSRFLEKSPDRVVREVTAVLGGGPSPVTLVVTQDYDYDGFCWATFAFRAPEPVEVKSLRLAVPLRNELVRFIDGAFHPEDKRAGPAPDLAVPAGEGVVWEGFADKAKVPAWKREKYASYVSPYLYVGGVFKGMSFLIESMRDLSVSWDAAPQRLVRAGDALRYEFDLVAKPTTWLGEKRIEMGFQPTPVKPKDPAHGKFAEVMYAYPCPSNAIATGYTTSMDMWRCVYPHMSYYPNDDRSLLDWWRAARKGDRAGFDRALADYIERNRAWLEESPVTSPEEYRNSMLDNRRKLGPSLMPRYCDPMLLSCYWPEWEMYKGEWYPWDWMCENYCNEYMCNLCASSVDKLMWDAKVALDTGDKGLYFDCFLTGFVSANWPQPDSGAYVRPDGSVQWSLTTTRRWREILKRAATLCYREGKIFNGRPFVEFHDTAGALTMLDDWAMTGLSTERGSDGGEFPIRFPESYTLVSIVGANSGKGSHFIVSGKKGDAARQTRELMSLVGYMCAYGLFALEDQGLVGGNRRFEKAWNIPFDFGWGTPEVEQFQYWNEEKTMPVTHTGKNVRVSVGRKKDAALVMFGSLGAEREDFTFDLSGLGFGAGAKVTDAETGEPFEGNRLSLGRFGYRMLIVAK